MLAIRVFFLVALIVVFLSISYLSNRSLEITLPEGVAGRSQARESPEATEARVESGQTEEPTGHTDDHTTPSHKSGELLNSTQTSAPVTTESTEVLNPVVDPETVYEEMTQLESVMRRYISGGHRLSLMNFETLREYGYLPLEMLHLSAKYTLGFKPTEDGFDIWIEPTFEISEDARRILLTKRNVRLVGQRLRYVFWIKAYR